MNVSEIEKNKLNTLYNEIQQICKNPTEDKLHRALDELNALDYSVKFADNEVGGNVIIRLIALINPRAEHALSKWCLLLINLVAKQQITLETGHLHTLVRYILNNLQKCSAWIRPDLLSALSAAVYENVGKLEKFWDELLNVLNVMGSSSGDSTCCTLKCLQNLTIRSRKAGEPYLREEHVLTCFSTFLGFLQRDNKPTDPVARCKVIISCLRGLGNLMGGSKICPLARLGELLGVIKSYLFYGLPGRNMAAVECLYPSPLCQFMSPREQSIDEPFASNRVSAQKRKTRKKRAARRKSGHSERPSGDEEADCDLPIISDKMFNIFVPNGFSTSRSPVSSSDSEYSDSEAGQAAKLRSLQSKVRCSAFGALQTVIKVVERKTMFGYWPAFLPDSPPSDGSAHWKTILTSILKDPSAQVRSSALAVLADLLDDSKQFLCLAEERSCPPPTAFTPLSATLAATIRELHRCLLLALLAESSSTIIIQYLKCISILVTNVPYHRLQPGLLTRLFRNLLPFLDHRDLQVQVACLTVVGSVLGIQPTLPEVIALFCSSFRPGEETQENSAVEEKNTRKETLVNPRNVSCTNSIKSDACISDTLPWIVILCRDNVLNPGSVRPVSLSLRLESLQVLAILCGNHFSLIVNHLDTVLNLLSKTLQDSQEMFLQYHAAKLLYAVGKSLSESLTPFPNGISKTPEVAMDKAVNFWESLLQGPLAMCLGETSHKSLQAACCDCLSNIGGTIFESLKHPTQMLCVTLVLGLVQDAEPSVRGSAVRCLGIFSLYASLSEDLSFLLDVGEAVVVAMNDTQFVVRFKAAWALGNLTDSFLLNRNKDYLVENISPSFLCSLGEAAVHSAEKDHDKIRSHAVRALGNLLYFIPAQILAKEEALCRWVSRACRSLMSSLYASLMKVRWNACYALGHFLRNRELLTYSFVDFSIDEVLCELMSVLEGCANFKVRINAVAALTAVANRAAYGKRYAQLWMHFLNVLQFGSEVSDFSEVKHRDSLCDQVCISLLLLATLMQGEDLGVLASQTVDLEDFLWLRFRKLKGKDLVTKDDSGEVPLLQKVDSRMMELHGNNLMGKELEFVEFLQRVVKELSEENASY